jgi:tripartite motif-containing protein 71
MVSKCIGTIITSKITIAFSLFLIAMLMMSSMVSNVYAFPIGIFFWKVWYCLVIPCYDYPMGLALDSSSNVYVADTSNFRIEETTNTGGLLKTWGKLGTLDGEFRGPEGIAINPSTREVYVADTDNNRIQKFQLATTCPKGTTPIVSGVCFISTWGSFGKGSGQFEAPRGVSVDSSGNVYVADTYNDRIQKFKSTGEFIKTWGSFGSDNGKFRWPYDVDVDSSDNLYVADIKNNRIQKFSNTGAFITTWGSDGKGNGQFSNPAGVAVDNSGNVFVTDVGNHRIQKFTDIGKFIRAWGTLGSGNGNFNHPVGIAIDTSGNVYIADFSNHRIQKFSNTGTFIRTWGSQGPWD